MIRKSRSKMFQSKTIFLLQGWNSRHTSMSIFHTDRILAARVVLLHSLPARPTGKWRELTGFLAPTPCSPPTWPTVTCNSPESQTCYDGWKYVECYAKTLSGKFCGKGKRMKKQTFKENILVFSRNSDSFAISRPSSPILNFKKSQKCMIPCWPPHGRGESAKHTDHSLKFMIQADNF